MKTNRFLSFVAIFAVLSMFFACSSEKDNDEQGPLSAGSDNNFLGLGYDVINSAYINPNDAIKYRNNSVLDQKKMLQDGIISNKPSKTYQENFETIAGSTVKDVIHERGLKIGASIEVPIPKMPIFSVGISGEFENVKNTGMKESIFFAKLNYYRYTEDYKIDGATKENLVKYLTDNFKKDLETKTAAQILNLYGTHVFVQYFKGGSFEANYTYAGEELTTKEAVRTAVGASFKGIIEEIGINISGDVQTTSSTTNLEKKDGWAINYQTFGGDAIGSTSLSELKSEFKAWTKSIDGKSELCGIANFNSLIPIWDLASASGYLTKANELKTKFDEFVLQRYLDLPLARKYKIDKLSHINITSNETRTLMPPDEAIIAEVEIYAIGAGGGGQGGNANSFGLGGATGTGGAGGGGAAIYAKLNGLELNKGEQVSLDIIIGTGGQGGGYMRLTGIGYTGTAGCNGEDGGETTVKWIAKNMAITAKGGYGAGGLTKCGEGGGLGVGGGTGGTCSTGNNYKCIIGGTGDTGNYTNDVKSDGGNTGEITEGSLAPFISFGGKRAKGNTPTQSGDGGGGAGGFSQTYGGNGGNGLVSIVVKSYMEE